MSSTSYLHYKHVVVVSHQPWELSQSCNTEPSLLHERAYGCIYCGKNCSIVTHSFVAHKQTKNVALFSRGGGIWGPSWDDKALLKTILLDENIEVEYERT